MAKAHKSRIKEDVNELSLLFDISRTLDESLDLRDVVNPVLKMIAKHTGMLRGTITLLNRETGEINIELSYRIQVKSGLTIQPDLQYIIDPGMNPNLKSAFVAGIRIEMEF